MSATCSQKNQPKKRKRKKESQWQNGTGTQNQPQEFKGLLVKLVSFIIGQKIHIACHVTGNISRMF